MLATRAQWSSAEPRKHPVALTSGPLTSIQKLARTCSSLTAPRSLFFWALTLLRNPEALNIKTINIPGLFKLAALAAICGPGFAACKAAAPSAPVAPPPVQASRVTDEPSKEIPPDLYKTMPMYPGATVEHVRKPKGAMREILFSSTASMPQMVAFYKEGLKKGDFHITSSLIMPTRKTWSCDFNYNGQPGSIMVYPSDQDKTKMTIDLIYELPAHMDESLMEPKEDFDIEGPGEIAQQAPNPTPGEKDKRN
jgi:hypothetical protein